MGNIVHSRKPPLHFYLDVITSRRWTRVDVITSGEEDTLNPTYVAIRQLNAEGLLGPNVHMHQVGRLVLKWSRATKPKGR